MSGKEQSHPQKAPFRARPSRRKQDARARRSCDRLGMALLQLIQEKPYAEVTVQEVLDRSSVGRSTFYLHYRDKNDLLLSQFERFLEFMSTMLIGCRERSLRVAPVKEMFDHIHEQMDLYRALIRAGRLHDFYDLAQGYFTRGIAQRITESGMLTHLAAREIEVRASVAAGGLLALLRWWLDSGAQETATALDETFHRLVWRGLREGRV